MRMGYGSLALRQHALPWYCQTLWNAVNIIAHGVYSWGLLMGLLLLWKVCEPVGHVQTQRLIHADIGEVFRYATDLSNLPNDLREFFDLEISQSSGELTAQAEFDCRLKRFGTEFKGRIQIEEIKENQLLTYRQLSGRFRSWRHTQVFKSHVVREKSQQKATLLMDLVDYRLPYGIFGSLIDDLWFRSDVTLILNTRLKSIEEHFAT